MCSPHQRVRAGVLFFLAIGFLRDGNAQQRPSATKPKRVSATSTDVGKQTFESICATCHGLDGRGGERGPDIATRAEILRRLDGALLRTIENGVPSAGMPAFQYLGASKLKAVLKHLRMLQEKGGVASLPGDPQKGKMLFAGKAGCAECHTVNGQGGFLGPDLSLYGATLSVTKIREAILFPNNNLEPRSRAVAVTTLEGKKYSGLARNEDNFSLQLQTQDGAFYVFTKTEIAALEYQQKSWMPDEYGTKLSKAELDDVISYLINVAQAAKPSNPDKNRKYEDDDF